MPLVQAAANVRSYSENLDPYNVSWLMGKNIYFAQTFPLTAGNRLFRTCFQVCCHTPFDPWQYSIRATDGAGKPLAVDLTMKERTSTNSAICNANRPGWQCMDWPFDSYSAGTYALVLARPGSPDTQRAEMHGITPATTTAAHKTWRSLDYGATWTEIANTELSHAVYGYTPPPDPPPPAAVGNWYITSIVQTLTPSGYQIVVTTNVPAHLFLRWTLAPPGQHIKTVMARGAPVQKIIDQCFVATTDVNQAEDGDTLTHTFLLEPWPVCQTRWFYFWGVRVMYRQPSVSPIYEKHRYAPPTPLTAYFYTMRYKNLGAQDTWTNRIANDLWPALRAGAGTTGLYSSFAYMDLTVKSSSTLNKFDNLCRIHTTFNTSTLGAGVTIVAARLKLYLTEMLQTLSLSSTAVVAAIYPIDYDDMKEVDHARIYREALSDFRSFPSLTLNAYNTFTFNALGLTKIAKTGMTLIGVQEGTYDLPNVSPTWLSNKANRARFATADTLLLAQTPRLEVDYFPP